MADVEQVFDVLLTVVVEMEPILVRLNFLKLFAFTQPIFLTYKNNN